MKAFVAVTDKDWFEWLSSMPEVQEVNFWQPSGRGRFRAIDPGDLLLFKLHYPDNFIAGGGFFAHHSTNCSPDGAGNGTRSQGSASHGT